MVTGRMRFRWTIDDMTAIRALDLPVGASSTSGAAGEASRTTQIVVATVVGDLKTTVDQFRY